MKRIITLLLVFAGFFPVFTAYGLELLSNESLDAISGKAVEDPRYDPPEVVLPDNTQDVSMGSYAQGRLGVHQSIIVQFDGMDAIDEFGNTYRQPYYATIEAENPVYENLFEGQDGPYGDERDYYAKNTYSYVAFEGMLKGKVTVPEYFDNNPAIKSKEIRISQSRLDLPEGFSGNILCSYKSNLFTPDMITEQDKSFDIYPNRQTITTGRAEGGDLAILLPHGSGENTTWKPVIKNIDPVTQQPEYLIIPEGESYVQISLNHMTSQTNMLFKVKLSHSQTKLAESGKPLPPDTGQSLGVFSMTGGGTQVNGGTVFITIN